MHKYYKERFQAQRKLAREVAPLLEVNEILEQMRAKLKEIIPSTMEACILLLDPDARKYTRPLQCALYDRPTNCLTCKRNRPAIQRAVQRKKAVVERGMDPIVRHDGTLIDIGPEAAMPVVVEGKIVAAVSLVGRPAMVFSRKDFYLLQDFCEFAGEVLLRAKRHWEMTQEKIRISQMLAHLSPFVPHSVRKIVEKNPELLTQEKERREVSVLFLDLEGYTQLSTSRPETEVNDLIERMFSRFVDPIHRSHGDINETAGDGLMIIFKDHDPRMNAVNAVKAAFDIYDLNKEINRDLAAGIGPIHVNMGINSGTALLGMTRFTGSLETRMTYTASGSVTNLAARLADYAKRGDILVGETTKEMIEGFWPLYALGEVRLKGIDAPERVFSLLAEGQSKGNQS